MPGNVFTETWKIRSKLVKLMRETGSSKMRDVMKSESNRFKIGKGSNLKRERKNRKEGFPVN